MPIVQTGTAPEYIRAGSTAFIECQIFDVTQETEPLLDPSGGTTLTLKKPDGSVYSGPTFLTRQSQGVYVTNVQTQTTDPLGTYVGDFISTNGSYIVRSLSIPLFQLVSA